MWINGRVGGWDAASSERHPSFLRYRSAARKGEHPVESASTPSPMNIPHKQSDSTNFTDGGLAFVDVLSPSCFYYFYIYISFSYFLLSFSWLNHSIKPISSKQKLDVEKHVGKSVKVWFFLVLVLIKIFVPQIYITNIINENYYIFFIYFR